MKLKHIENIFICSVAAAICLQKGEKFTCNGEKFVSPFLLHTQAVSR